MKFPYGLSDFYDIITETYFYIDRTDRIPLIETTGKHLLFPRPRALAKAPRRINIRKALMQTC